MTVEEDFGSEDLDFRELFDDHGEPTIDPTKEQKAFYVALLDLCRVGSLSSFFMGTSRFAYHARTIIIG